MKASKPYKNAQPSIKAEQTRYTSATSVLFDKIYRSYYNRLCAYAYPFVKDHSVAEDIVQQSFLKLWEKNQNLDFSYDLTSLLYTVVRRTALDHLKKSRDIPTAQEGLELLSKNNVVNEMIYSETLVEIFKIAKHLPEKCNDIFNRIFLQGKENSEIADELHISESTVRVQKLRAISFLRFHLSKISSFLLFFV